ncbi:MAG: EAL domain-containing protein [Actinomycetota bacterium]|nr:EAL domain-containing protein [Actinomycetota bacterium]
MEKPDTDRPAARATALGSILDGGHVRSVFQPIVDLQTGRLFGFEALARGPQGSALEHPAQLFAAARKEGRLQELDAVCQQAALAGAAAHELSSPLTLFVNAEPDTLGIGALPTMGRGMRGVVELTERTLTTRLAELLPAVQRARAAGWGIALDDVGADTRSLALMPLLRPDVIKLDLRLVQDQPTPEIAAIAGAVAAQAERTGATVVAEGVETQEQAVYARALGATMGQGLFFGGPTPTPNIANVTGIPLPIFTAALPHPWRTPFDLASGRRPVRHGTLPLLAAISRELERQAAQGHRTSLLISSFPEADQSTARLDTVYEELAANLAFVAAVSVGLSPKSSPGLRIRDDDPLLGTWNVVVIGAHFAAMLAARETGHAELRAEQEYDFVFTYNRDVIVECAQALMLRIAMDIS